MNVLRIARYLIVVAIFSAVAIHAGRQLTRGWVKDQPAQSRGPQSRSSVAPVPSPTSRARPVEAGSDPVKAMQLNLVACGVLPKDQVDGRLGPATISAIQTLQYAAGLEADGVFGPLTRRQAQRCKAAPTAG